MLTFGMKQILKTVIYKGTNTLSSLLNMLLIVRDFFRACHQSPPFSMWTKSYLDWVLFDLSATARKCLSYILPSNEKKMLEIARNKAEADKRIDYLPLVSVIIPTYNRADVLLKRSIPSVLSQTYKNLEIIVVGDHCTDNTETEIRKIQDSRVKFINLLERGNYPTEPILRWWVAGVTPVNVGLQESKGDWIAHLDDDDEFSSDHIEVLLKFALKHNFEMVYGVVEMEKLDGSWVKVGSPILRRGGIGRCSSLYRAYLKCFKYVINSWKMKEPADFNLWRRMKMAGVRIGFINMVVGRHYKERAQINR